MLVAIEDGEVRLWRVRGMRIEPAELLMELEGGSLNVAWQP
jgi:hypothetical protein